MNASQALSENFQRILELADVQAAARDPRRLRWMWGQGLFLHSLLELDDFLGEARYLPFVREYLARFKENPPKIDQSDTCAPALAAWGTYRRTGDEGERLLVERVVRFMKTEPRLVGEATNHLGHSPIGRLYPKSVWVDSLMMFGVFAAKYASDTGDKAFLDFAARQPGLYAKLLQDPATGLFSHSYWTVPAHPYPRNIFWGRGNGWVVAALPMILGFLPSGHPERAPILGILERISSALLSLQRSDGYWDTILEKPGRTYRESSATALISCGWMRVVREGLLGQEYLGPALKAFDALVDSLGPRVRPPAMREISSPTIPLPLFPYLGYALVPRARDLSYGLAALFLAAIERERLSLNPLPASS